MHTQFCCESENCRSTHGKAYQIAIQSEAIMDDHNLASMFCPHCNTPLVHCRQTADCRETDS